MSLSTPVLATKFYIPQLRPNIISRQRLIEPLQLGMHGSATLVSAPAGFGKTTLVAEWVKSSQRPIAWLALDQADSDVARFLIYLIHALQRVAPTVGQGALAALQLPQMPPPTLLLTTILNDLAEVGDGITLVLDDYHEVDSQTVDQALTFLLEHLPPQHHLVVATREEPNIPLARLRARGQLNEVRARDLRFTAEEAAHFLNQAMALSLTTDEINALENRTEGWIAGLQLAALSLHGHSDSHSFIQSFTGSHRFVMDYLVEEVLHQQPQAIQTFLLRTSILNRFCAPLCDSLLAGSASNDSQHFGYAQHKFTTRNSQSVLEYLEQANLFIIPLDNERRWYRYHHLFAELLRQRLQQEVAASTVQPATRIEDLHIRASQWYEANNLALEAFHHATTANDIERAERLIDGDGMPLHLRGAALMILNWLDALPEAVLCARPWLWWRQAALLLVNGHTTGVAEKLQAAEDALQNSEWDERLGDKTRNFVGRIATARSVLALTRYDVESMLTQSQRALDYLDASSLSSRANAYWTLGFASFLQGKRTAARAAYQEAIALGERSGDIFATLLATLGLGDVQQADTQLHAAAETYRKVLQMAGDQPLTIVNEAYLGMARLLYEWNDLAAAEQYATQALNLARQYDQRIDRFIVCELLLARLQIAKGNPDQAEEMLAQLVQSAQQRNFVLRLPDIIEMRVFALLQQKRVDEAAQLAQSHNLPISQARVLLSQGESQAALALLEPLHQQATAKELADDMLRITVLQALAYHRLGDDEQAVIQLTQAVTLAQPGGYVRLFIDEGLPMAELLKQLAQRETAPLYVRKLLASFPDSAFRPSQSELIEPLSERESEVLQLLATGHSDQEIANRLLVSLNTVRYHTKNLYGKLGVNKRTQAVAKAQELKLL